MRQPLLLACTAFACATSLAGAGLPPFELFPVEPGVNTERGFAVAVDGDWLAMGAHRDDEKQRDAGAVYLFKWSGTTWDQRAKLFAGLPQERAHFGFSLALRDGVLAAGAPGEGAVHLFALYEKNAWVPAGKLTGPPRAFGRSLALEGNRLAVGAVGGHGVTDGAVHLFVQRDGSWRLQQKLQPRTRREGERFGAAVSLAGKILAVGAPGSGGGAVYVFQPDPIRWKEKVKLPSPDGEPQADDQLGAAVATDGMQIFAGAPTAGLDNAGAVYRFEQGAGGWFPQKLEIEAAPGDQLGTSLAVSGDLLVAGAPAPPPGSGTGKVHVLLSGELLDFPVPRNAEKRDLAGFAVAVSGGRVVVGGALGDQGAGAAGAVWSFDCSGEEECTEEAEAVARDPETAPFGVSVAMTDKYLAIGAPQQDGESAGVVYLYRRAERGWRQEARLTSPAPSFGFSVSLDGENLVVGAPRSPDFLNGVIYLYSRQEGSWTLSDGFEPVHPAPEEAFGTSVSVSGDVVAVGAPRGVSPGAVYFLEKVDGVWTQSGGVTAGTPGDDFGASVSLRGDILAIGAPEANGGVGAAYVSVRQGQGWSTPELLLGRTGRENVVINLPGIGASVSLGDDFLAVGAPGSQGGNGAVFLIQREGAAWGQPVQISSQARRRLGSSVALLGDRLVVGGPGTGTDDPFGNDLDRAVLFERGETGWVFVRDFDAIQPPHGDRFGTAVALSKDFLVVTGPGPTRGDRVTVFPLTEEGDP